jgi:hypothetical protein
MMLDPLLDFFRGKAVTIPPMDGPLRPNNALEEAEVLLACDRPDNLIPSAGNLLFSSGGNLMSLDGKIIASFDAQITALASDGNVGLAIGLDSGRIEIRGSLTKTIDGFNCPVALAFDGPDTLYVCNGSGIHKPSDWVFDVMGKQAGGSVWHVSLATGERRCLARDLAFPFGVAVDRVNDRLIVAESWRHRLIGIPLSGGGAPVPLLSQLPGYPARLSPLQNRGMLLSLFAPRNRLIEFVLLEDDYRATMIGEIDSRYWIAPSLSASRSFLEPLQSGAVKSMGIHKPWSPSRSWGLVVELDANLQPTASYHSRANGTRHGVMSAVEHEDTIIAASKGGDAILRIQRTSESSP